MVQYVITLANSVVGVSVLALPFCFQQCGIVLATLMLVMGAIMTRIVCHFLLKGGTLTRRRTYELLAYHTYGHTGKLLAELTIIVFLLGTLIAFLVVMGDLGPVLVAEIFDIENNSSLRTVVMTGLALFVALPLGLLKNIDSLGSVSVITLMFYVVLVCKVLAVGVGPLWSGMCLNQLNYWRPTGILQCIPIFAMALSCQTQIFPIYDSLPDPSLAKMNSIVKSAVHLCTGFYFCVGFFGYVAFCSEPVTGNILVNFKPTWSTQIIKSCFVFSIALSVPIVVLPLRASLHSMIFRNPALSYHHLQDASSTYIPEGRLRLLTVGIIGSTLVIGLMIPNIELVLGLVGSTAGSIICIIFPALMFISLTPKNTTEKLVAKCVLLIGLCILVLTTYATLYAADNPKVQEPVLKQEMEPLFSEAVPKSVSESIIKNIERVSSKAPLPEIQQPKKDESEPQIQVVEPIEPKVIPKDPENPPAKASVSEPDVKLPEKEIVAEKLLPDEKDKPKPSEQVLEEVNIKKDVQQQEIRKELENTNVKDDQLQIPKEAPPAVIEEPKVEIVVPVNPVKEVKRYAQVNEIRKEELAAGSAAAPNEKTPAKVENNQIVQEETKLAGHKPAEQKIVAAVPAAGRQLPRKEEKREVHDKIVESNPKKNESPAAVVETKKEVSPKAPLDNEAAEELLKKLAQQQEEQRKLIEEQKQVLEELKKHHEEHDQADAEIVDSKQNVEPELNNEAKKNDQVNEQGKAPEGEQIHQPAGVHKETKAMPAENVQPVEVLKKQVAVPPVQMAPIPIERNQIAQKPLVPVPVSVPIAQVNLSEAKKTEEIKEIRKQSASELDL